MTATLSKRQATALQGNTGTRVTCVDGMLWLTQDGADIDAVLRAGQSWTARREGLVVVQALGGAARWSATAPVETSKAPGWLSRLFARAA